MINGNEARLVERYLTFKEGLAYGIDQLLEPPGLGAYCDSIENRTTYVSCANTITFNTANALILTAQMLILVLVVQLFLPLFYQDNLLRSGHVFLA